MKKTAKKLVLSKETVRGLGANRVSQVAGGQTGVYTCHELETCGFRCGPAQPTGPFDSCYCSYDCTGIC